LVKEYNVVGFLYTPWNKEIIKDSLTNLFSSSSTSFSFCSYNFCV
jgi:hypothetical protein